MKALRLMASVVLVWTCGSGVASAALSIDSAAVTPTTAPVGVATAVTVTATITDPSLLPESVNLQRYDTAGRAVALMGQLRDDGQNGDAAAGDRTFTLRVTIFEQAPGPLTVRVSAAFRGSLLRTLSAPLTVNVTGATATGIAILAPADLAYLNTSPIVVSGSVGDANATVTINGVPAVVNKGAKAFTASVPLVEGTNTLTAVATNSGGTTSSAALQVTLDTTPPHLAIESPSEGLTTTDAAVTVSGTVNDIVVGTVNSQQAQVGVNGVAATVANRSFLAANIPLAMGLNTIQAVGRDRSGNSVTTSVHVTRVPQTTPSIRIVSGNNQSAPVSTALPAPLVVALTNSLGQPVAGSMVVFNVEDNNGLVTGAGATAASVAVATDAAGRAQVSLKLGSRSGAGRNRVEAAATGFNGVAAFTATGTPTAASLITVDSGNNQTGALGTKLAFPFVVVVTDAGFNRLGGVPVTFVVRAGGGTIGGKATLQMNTDPDGRAAAFLSVGTEPGLDNNLVEVTFTGNPGQPAAFIASAKTPGNAADTKISGVVLDNSNNPIEAVTVRLFKTNQGNNNNTPVQVGTPVKTNAQGQFLIAGAPVGFFKLMADGTTVAPQRGVFPTLEYDIVTVAGQDNTVGMPLLLPLLDVSNKLCVNETTGGTLTLPEVPGFSLTVAAGSATFPGGARSGCVTVSTVNADKSPMTPGFGQQPRFLITIQPVGTTFNPPAPITMPNVDGLQPGQVTELYSYDHDLSAFVAIGTGTVSEDGLLVSSDPGVGILKAGWHCGGNPATGGSVAPLTLAVDKTKVIVAINQPFSITASGSPPLDAVYEWTIGSTTVVTATNGPPTCANSPTCVGQFKGTANPGTTTVKVCIKCTTTGASDCKTVDVIVAKVTIEKPTGDPVAAGSADNEFTYAGAAGVATIPVRAKVEPASAAAELGDKIRWSLVSTPTGSALSWDATWPGDATKGKGVSTNAKLTGLPASNGQFGGRAVRMELVLDTGVAATETASIELFFERDTVTTGFTTPNWFRFWLEAMGGRANTAYGGAGANYGETPGMLFWSYGTARDKTRVDIFDLARTADSGDACSTGGKKATTGIDTFEDTLLHENHHTVQVATADAAVGVVPNTAWRFGWAWNVGANHNHWTLGPDGKPGAAGVDDDGDGTVDNQKLTGPGELGKGDDVDLTDTGDPILAWPKAFGALPPLCWPTGLAVEKPAYDKEPDNEDSRANVDWANPGKQHRTRSAND